MDIFKYMLAVVLIVLFALPISVTLMWSAFCFSSGYFWYFALLVFTSASLFFTCMVVVDKCLKLK